MEERRKMGGYWKEGDRMDLMEEEGGGVKLTWVQGNYAAGF